MALREEGLVTAFSGLDTRQRSRRSDLNLWRNSIHPAEARC